MSAIETPRDKLITELKLRLGDGMIDVELDPEHYNLAIDRAIQTFRSRRKLCFPTNTTRRTRVHLTKRSTKHKKSLS